MKNYFKEIGYAATQAAKAISGLSFLLNNMDGGKNNPIKFSKRYKRK